MPNLWWLFWVSIFRRSVLSVSACVCRVTMCKSNFWTENSEVSIYSIGPSNLQDKQRLNSALYFHCCPCSVEGACRCYLCNEQPIVSCITTADGLHLCVCVCLSLSQGLYDLIIQWSRVLKIKWQIITLNGWDLWMNQWL